MNRTKQAGLTVALLAFGGLGVMHLLHSSARAVRAGESMPYNTAPDEPKGATTESLSAPTRLAAADGIIDSGRAWGHSGPWVEDVDGDGLRDLVVGDFSGLFHYYRNRGTNLKPSYAAAVNLQAGGTDAKVPIY
jgi:hypothetical protein